MVGVWAWALGNQQLPLPLWEPSAGAPSCGGRGLTAGAVSLEELRAGAVHGACSCARLPAMPARVPDL